MKTKKLMSVLRLAGRPGSPGERTAALNSVSTLLAEPELLAWVLERLEGGASSPAGDAQLRQQIATLTAKNSDLEDRLRRETKLKTEARDRLRKAEGDLWLPRSGLRMADWWAVLVERGDGILFNAHWMSKAAGAPSKRNFYRFQKTLDFIDEWRVYYEASPKPHIWHATEASLTTTRVLDYLHMFNALEEVTKIQAPDGTEIEPIDWYQWQHWSRGDAEARIESRIKVRGMFFSEG